MRNGWLWGVLLLLPVTGWASGGHGGAEPSVPEYINHHVLDAHEYEFELPGPLFPSDGKNPHIDLFQTFSFLRIELSPGVCGPDFYARPGLTEGFAQLFAGCIDLRPTKHTVMLVLAGFLLVVALLWGSHRDRTKLVPRGTLANLFEMLVLFVRNDLAIKNIGKEEGPRYTPYLLSVFFFILFMNLLGLFPWMATATANVAVTAALALCTFVLTQAAGIRAAGLGGYLKHLTGGVHWLLWPIMVPVEVLGLFTKPFALTMRLFANMLAGHIVIFFLLGLIFMLTPAMAPVSVLMAMGIYLLELFVAFLQAYVFTMLSALFIGMGVAMAHHHGHDEGHAAHH